MPVRTHENGRRHAAWFKSIAHLIQVYRGSLAARRRGGRERFFRFRARYGYGPRRIVSSRRVHADGNATDREGMRGLTVSDVFDLFGDPEIVRRTSLASDRALTVARFRVLHPGE